MSKAIGMSAQRGKCMLTATSWTRARFSRALRRNALCEILESVAPQRLVLSWRSEWSAEFKAEGNSKCVFEIEPTGPSSKLTLTHSSERPNSKFIGAVADGWPMVISNLKSLLETGEVALVYHRRHEDSTRRGS